MPEQLPEELSREKVPGALSKAPNINGSAPPRVRIKLGGAGDRFGGFCLRNLTASGQNQFINTKFTRPITKTSKPSKNQEEVYPLLCI